MAVTKHLAKTPLENTARNASLPRDARQHRLHADTGSLAAVLDTRRRLGVWLGALYAGRFPPARGAGQSGAVLSRLFRSAAAAAGPKKLHLFCPGLAGPRLGLACAESHRAQAGNDYRRNARTGRHRANRGVRAPFRRHGRSAAIGQPFAAAHVHHHLHRPVQQAGRSLDFSRPAALWQPAAVWPHRRRAPGDCGPAAWRAALPAARHGFRPGRLGVRAIFRYSNRHRAVAFALRHPWANEGDHRAVAHD